MTTSPFRSLEAVRYIITCPARTGSSALVSYLRSHPDICSHGEVFGAPTYPLDLYGVLPPKVAPPLREWLAEYRQNDPIGFLQLVFYPGTKRAVGCKFKFEELDAPDNESISRAVYDDASIRIIYLTRRNLLERYVSQYLAVHVHNQFNVHRGDPLPPPVTIRLEAADLEQEFAFTQGRQERFRALFAEHPVFELTYEDLCAHPTDRLNALQEFLGVESQLLETRLTKLQQRKMADVLDNYEELRAHFAHSPYAAFFDGAGTPSRDP